MTKISQRLQSVIKYLEKTMHIADIGSDHGDLPIYLSDLGYTRLYASDNKKGPYSHLVSNIKNANKEELIETKLTDGLKELPEDIDTVLILGMGGFTIDQILRISFERVKSLDLLILSPQSETYEFRNFLNKNKMRIIDEYYVEENKKYYPIIVCKYDENYVVQDLTFAELTYGKIAIENKDPVLLNKLTEDYNRYQTLPMIILRKDENRKIVDTLEYLLKNWYM